MAKWSAQLTVSTFSQLRRYASSSSSGPALYLVWQC